MKSNGSVIIPVMVLMLLVSTLTGIYFSTQKNSTERLQSRTYKTNIEGLRAAIVAAIEDPQLCTQMLRGKLLPPVWPMGPPLTTPANIQGTTTTLNMNFGPLPWGTGPLGRGWPYHPQAPRDWPTIGDIKLWTDGKFLGYVVLDRPRTIAGGQESVNPREHWYETYEARILVYGLQGPLNPNDPNSRVGHGGGLPPTPNSLPAPPPATVDLFNSLTIPIIVHVRYRTNNATPAVISSCYSPTSFANFCRTIDNYIDPNPTAPKITGGYDVDPPPPPIGSSYQYLVNAGLPQWAGLNDITYAPYRCHPETCLQMNVGGGIYADSAGVNCPKPYMDQRLGTGAGQNKENCMWCNHNRDLPGGVIDPAPSFPPPLPCAADFFVACTGTSLPSHPPVVYTMVACDDDPDPIPYVSIRRGKFGTGWQPGLILNYSPPGEGRTYSLITTVLGNSATITGTPGGACPQTGTACMPCTATQNF